MTGAVEGPPCPACGVQEFAPLRDGRFGRYHLSRCTGCGHVATRPEPQADELAALYGEYYHGPEHRRFRAPLEVATTMFRRRRARRIARRRAPGTVLDVGCGRGVLLDAFRRHGWSVVGTELSDETAQYARDVLGMPVHVGEFHRLNIPPASVDVVIMWQTFEHMREPNAVLRRAHEVLRPGGWLIVSVPNRESWQARVAGARWLHLDVPRHLHHYAAATLRRMLERAGFRVTRVEHFNAEQNPFGWLQSLLNMATPTSANGLFDALRSGNGDARRRRVPLASVALLPLLAPLALGLATAESVARRGGTVTLWAAR
jgi:2-polyprenyl-3-methyl-5-hydroxy-6-metoxy-1,4-benzoquinol methylase